MRVGNESVRTAEITPVLPPQAVRIRHRRILILGAIVLVSHLLPPALRSLAAQSWNTAPALALVRRAVDRRVEVQADSTLASYRARAHGFVFFLAQVGEGLRQPPRLVKADELGVEVYWRAPNHSKQVIKGWRDGTFLPTDISYHRDHLGIVTNNFGNLIRIGEGDEVRDAIHPLSPDGLDAYDFALSDSLAILTAAGEVMVYQVQVRPRSFSRPLVLGNLYIDVATAELVRFRFSFTPASYLDRQLEDISVVLESALYQKRYWLPRRQEVEIRRRVTWLDFPARGIIRGRWDIEGYDLNVDIPLAVFTGPEIGGLLQPGGTDSAWTEPLEQAVAAVAKPLNQQDVESLRLELQELAGTHALGGLPSKRLAARSLSDLVRVNRVQGLALGLGATLKLEGTRIQLRPSLGYGTSDGRVTGEVLGSWSTGATDISIGASRRIDDFSDIPVIAPVLNSLLSQEAGKDHGDYVLLQSVDLGLRQRLGGRTAISLGLSAEESQSIRTQATPASGTYRDNPLLGSGTYGIARLLLERASAGMAARSDLQGRWSVEVGDGPSEYLRTTAQVQWLAGLKGSQLLTRFYLGAGTRGLPPHRSFVVGGRGTLLGEPFRKYGGRYEVLGHLEWRRDVPVPALSLGSFASTGSRITLAPFVAAGYTAEPLDQLPYSNTGGVRPVAGLAIELFMRLLRVEAGIGLRDGVIGVIVDVNRDWWGLL